MFQDLEELLGGSLDDFALTDGVESLVLPGEFPAFTGAAGFGGDDLFHDVMPGAGAQRRIARGEIGAGDLEVQDRLPKRFVPGMKQGFSSEASRVRRLVCLPVERSWQ